MDLLTAKGALCAVVNGGKAKFKSGPFSTYASGHDDKHRSAVKAYSYNHGSETGDDPASFYQKKVNIQVATGEMRAETLEKFVGWDKPKLVTTIQVPVMKNAVGWADLSLDDECDMLWKALISSAKTYYASAKKANRFNVACSVPDDFSARSFKDGGLSFPKKATDCDRMVMVFQAGNSNVQLVTHFPDFQNFIDANWTLLK